ncbi:MAG: FKBP-type peptidyl-prolyl cis-trans isomerase [Bacteroidia bacterium]
MRIPYLIICVVGALLLSACGGDAETTTTTTTTNTTAPTGETTPRSTQSGPSSTNTPVPSNPVPTGMEHEPFKPEDDEDYTELEGGVKLFFIRKGDGPLPTKKQVVRVHYHAMLKDGKVFDSSYDRGVPLDVALEGTLKGWQVGLMNAPVGSKAKLIIPPTMGHGSISRPGIPANSTLVYDFELLEIL